MEKKDNILAIWQSNETVERSAVLTDACDDFSTEKGLCAPSFWYGAEKIIRLDIDMIQKELSIPLFAYMLKDGLDRDENYLNAGMSFIVGHKVKGPAFICKSKKNIYGKISPVPLESEELKSLKNVVTRILRENALNSSFFDYESTLLDENKYEEMNEAGEMVKKTHSYYLYRYTLNSYEYTGEYDESILVEVDREYVGYWRNNARIHSLPLSLNNLEEIKSFVEEKKQWSRWANNCEVLFELKEKFPIHDCLIDILIHE